MPTEDDNHTTSRTPDTIGEATLNKLPMLTEIVSGTDHPAIRSLSDDEVQTLLRQLEGQLETLFTKKLSMRLEELQRVAIDQALDELKAELPELLREALDEFIHPR